MVDPIDLKARRNVRYRDVINWNAIIFFFIGMVLVFASYLMSVGSNDGLIGGVSWQTFGSIFLLIAIVGLYYTLRDFIRLKFLS